MLLPISLLTALVLLALSAPTHAAASCAAQLDALRQFLDHAVIAVGSEVESVRSDPILSEATRGEFVRTAEWLGAWLRDQSARLASAKECGDLPQRTGDIRAQLMPVVLLSWKVQTARLAWELDRFSRVLEERGAGEPPERRAVIAEARGLLMSARSLLAQLDGAATLEAFPIPLRRAAFLTRQGLRSLRFHGILE